MLVGVSQDRFQSYLVKGWVTIAAVTPAVFGRLAAATPRKRDGAAANRLTMCDIRDKVRFTMNGGYPSVAFGRMRR
jgi:hypothetical protein